MTGELTVDRGATLSDCGAYRYELWRRWSHDWSDPGTVVFIMLNPSTADAHVDDPTIRKCIGFAKRMGRRGIHVVNLFAYRATKPVLLCREIAPVGPANDKHICNVLRQYDSPNDRFVCAWGSPSHAAVRQLVEARAPQVEVLLRECDRRPLCFGRSQDGSPRHPLMLPYAADLALWRPA